MTLCDLRNIECSCPPDQCRAAPPVIKIDQSLFTNGNRIAAAIIALAVSFFLIGSLVGYAQDRNTEFAQDDRR